MGIEGTEVVERQAAERAFAFVLSGSDHHVGSAIIDGIDVHVARTLHGADHGQVKRFCRYLARPSIAQDRLELLEDGRVRYRFKRAWKDGSTAVDLVPVRPSVPRLCALIPPPRFDLVRYHGVLSSRAKLRAEVVPSPPEPEPARARARPAAAAG